MDNLKLECKESVVCLSLSLDITNKFSTKRHVQFIQKKLYNLLGNVLTKKKSI